MKRLFTGALVALGLLSSASSYAEGWPANYEGVMLQGFYWDSFSDTKWTNITAQADELSQYFKLIWVPNSGNVGGGNNMGYMPIYWFTNHNTCFGTEAQLATMISTYKAKGVGFIADVVVNHRNGKSNWTDFPDEEWNGTTWHIGPEGICSTDEVKWASGQPTPTGAPDTGDDFDGCRDLDHTNANVQNNVKNYCKCLLEKYGYAGFRLDMVKGYGGQYTKIYNQYSKPKYCVGEYWDANYDAVAAWIEATGKESAAFDFPFKYAVNEAFHSGDLRKLVWKANGTTDQPAGMIHWWYPQYSVTFIDNHDTYRDGSKFNGNVVAANAFMLCSPGTPCVFLAHYKNYKSEIQNLINIRNSVGLHNQSSVKVLKSEYNCYMAEVDGKNGKLVVKIGSAMVSPDGYSNSDIKAAGTDYCVWTKTNVNGGNSGGGSTVTPSGSVTIEGDYNLAYSGSLTKVYYWGASQPSWPGETMATAKGSDGKTYKVFKVPEGTTGIIFNSNGDSDKTQDLTYKAGYVFDNNGATSLAVTFTNGGGGNQGGGNDTPDDDNNGVSIYVDGWDNVHAYIYKDAGGEVAAWPGVAMTKDASTGYWKYDVPADYASGSLVIINTAGGSNRYPADMEPGMPLEGKSMIFHVANNGWEAYSGGNGGGNQGGGNDTPDPNAEMWVLGNLVDGGWGSTPGTGFGMSKSGNVYTADGIQFATMVPTDKVCYFNITDYVGATWDDLNMGANRYGAASEGEALTPGVAAPVVKYANNVDASACKSWTIAPGTYNLVLDLGNMTIKAVSSTGIDEVLGAEEAAPVYFNLQGVRVENPRNGIFIRVINNKSSKVVIK